MRNATPRLSLLLVVLGLFVLAPSSLQRPMGSDRVQTAAATTSGRSVAIDPYGCTLAESTQSHLGLSSNDNFRTV